jgi:hypothetical protein
MRIGQWINSKKATASSRWTASGSSSSRPSSAAAAAGVATTDTTVTAINLGTNCGAKIAGNHHHQTMSIASDHSNQKTKDQRRALQERQNSRRAVATTTMTANEAIVASFAERLNLEQDVGPLFADTADLLFQEAPMTVSGFQDEMRNIHKSFPDFRIAPVDGAPITERPDGTVHVTFCVTGTHTGPAYSFGPYPAIETTGIAIQLDAEYVSPCFVWLLPCVLAWLLSLSFVSAAKTFLLFPTSHTSTHLNESGCLLWQQRMQVHHT